MIFASTGGISARSAAETAADFYSHGISGVELSGGAISSTYETDLMSLAKTMSLQVHNYYPPPTEPFVFNLASADQLIAERSVQHVKNAMRLAVSLGRPLYSFLAGFRMNPLVAELGKPFRRHILRDRESAINQFAEKVLFLAEEARREGVTLLIENNVLNAENKAKFGDDPLLMTNPDEIISFMEEMPSNVGLLLDVAHLKVSARTLGFDPVEAHEKLKSWIQGYHLSDNDGTTDSNNPILTDSWFWEIIKPGLNYYSLEVYRVSSAELSNQYKMVKEILDHKVK
jgi:sugar phosphate isomerase/epimerase